MFNTQGQYAQQFYKDFDNVEATGIWAAPQKLKIHALYSGLGRVLMFEKVSALQTNPGIISFNLPDSDLAPPIKFIYPITGIDDPNAFHGPSGAILQIDTDGSCIIKYTTDDYSGSDNGGFEPFSVSYISNPTPL